MKNDKFLPYVVIIGVVAVVAIVSLFLWSGSIEGAAIRSYVAEDQALCSDDDPTNDHYKSGIVRYGKVQYDDYCVDGLLYQHYCQSLSKPRVSTPGFKCPNGCLNGRCLR